MLFFYSHLIHSSEMKPLLALLGVALPFLAHGATLVWDPSPPSTNNPPVAFYRAYSSPVVHPTNALWTAYGETTSTNLVITNNVWRMFQVRAVSSGGAESPPSNNVTNNLAAPLPPGTAIITGQLESAPTMNGPWRVLATNQLEVPVNESNQFFRESMRIVMASTPPVARSTTPQLERRAPFTPPPLPR